MSLFLFGPIYRSVAKVCMERIGRVVRLPAMTYLRFMWEKLGKGDLGSAIYYLEKASKDIITRAEQDAFATGVEAVLAEIDLYTALIERKGGDGSTASESERASAALAKMRSKVEYIGKPIQTFDDPFSQG